jgi:hypothetical protein
VIFYIKILMFEVNLRKLHPLYRWERGMGVRV